MVKRRNIFILVVAVICGTVLGVVWLATRPRYDDLTVKIAKQNGWDLEDYARTREFSRKKSRHLPFTMEDWKDVERFVASGPTSFRGRNALMLTAAKDTEFEEEAIAISRELLKDPRDGLRAMGMTNLHALDAPGWIDVVKDNLDDEAEIVRRQAQFIWYKHQEKLLKKKLDSH